MKIFAKYIKLQIPNQITCLKMRKPIDKAKTDKQINIGKEK